MRKEKARLVEKIIKKSDHCVTSRFFETQKFECRDKNNKLKTKQFGKNVRKFDMQLDTINVQPPRFCEKD